MLSSIILSRSDGNTCIAPLRRHYGVFMDHCLSVLLNNDGSSKDSRDTIVTFVQACLKVASFGYFGGLIPDADPMYNRLHQFYDALVNDKVLLIYFSRISCKPTTDDSAWLPTDLLGYLHVACSLIHHVEAIKTASMLVSNSSSIIHKKKRQRLEENPWETVLRCAFGIEGETSSREIAINSVTEKPHWLLLLWFLIRKFPQFIPTGPRGYVISSMVIRLSRIILVSYASYVIFVNHMQI
jgi:hypothetical protein